MKIYHELSSNKIIGVNEIKAYLQGKLTLAETKELVAQKTRQYAKRQFTWMRGWKNLNHFDLNDLDMATIQLKNQLNLDKIV